MVNVSTILSPILGIGQLYCFCVLTDRDVVEVNKHTHTKKRTGLISSPLGRRSLVNIRLLFRFRILFIFRAGGSNPAQEMI